MSSSPYFIQPVFDSSYYNLNIEMSTLSSKPLNLSLSNSCNPDCPGLTSAVAGLVNNVAEGWCCHLAEKNTLALFIPSKLFSSTLSRENFVDLLEYCEEHLKVRRILACFNKSDINPCQGIPRALRCIGFTLLPPDRYPSGIDKSSIFAMVYKI
uniref:Ornithine decarboxylase antizyme n=1 Tax=Globodera rostochiensis TaxID=31243 RepID=A0A914HUJ8_GLORO